jgi:uncharacterized coiled-coil protein SlyX
MDEVVKGLANVYKGVDSVKQWNRAVIALSKLDCFETAQSWLALTSPLKGKEDYATLLGYKILFKQAKKQVHDAEIQQNNISIDTSEINRSLEKSISLCKDFQILAEKLDTYRSQAIRTSYKNSRLQHADPAAYPSESESNSTDSTPQIGPIGQAPAATTAPPPAASSALAAQLQASTADVRLALRALDERVQADNKKLIEKVAAQEADVNEVKAKLTKLGPKIEAIKTIDGGKLDGELDRLNDKVGANEAEARALKTQLERLEATVGGLGVIHLQQQMADLKGKITNRETIELATKDLVANVQTQVADLAKRVTAAATAPSAAGVDETKLENKITENVRIGLIADAKAKLDTLQKDNTTTLTAAIDAMKQEATVAVETVKKENTTAVSEMKEDWKKEVEELNTWLAEENERVKQGEDAMRQMVDEVHDMTEKAAFSNEVYHLAREKAGFGVSGMHIKAAIDQIGNGRPSSVDDVRKQINEKWAEPRHKATEKSPYTVPAYVLPEPSEPAAARRQSLTGQKPAKGTLPGAKRPASHATTDTRSMFSSIFGESPYVFADD